MFDAGLILIALLLGIVAWLRADPNRRQRAAAWLACGWVLPSAAFLGYISSALDIWPAFVPLTLGPAPGSWAIEGPMGAFYPSPHVVIFAGPLIVLVWRVVIWGWAPALLFPRLDLRLVYLVGVLADQALLRFTLLIVRGSLTVVLFHAAMAAACILPAQCFSRWTRERNYLPMRAWMHFIFHSTLLLGVLSMLMLNVTSGFGAPFLRSSVINKLLLQLLLIPAVLLASSMREFYLGGGTPMPADAPLRLVNTGPYAYVANPMQIGKFGVLAAWAIFWSSTALFAVALFGLLYSLTIASPREDREMLARFGSHWTRYRNEVRRWWPRWRPYFPAANSTSVSSFARLYLDTDCRPCVDLAKWLTRQKLVGLQVLPLSSYSKGHAGTIVYDPADGNPEEQGIRALSRAAEHLNLLWAFFGWIVNLPGVSWLARLIADSVTVRTRSAALCAYPATLSSVVLSQSSSSQPTSSLTGVSRMQPERAALPEAPSSPCSHRPPEPIVWIVSALSSVLVVLVCLFLFWKGSTSEQIWQLRHGSASSRLQAAHDLARSGPATIAAAPALKEALQDSDIRIQTVAADALLRMGAWQELQSGDWISKADPASITAATTNIANAFPPPLEALPVLQEVLRKHPSADVRENVTLALGHYGGPALPALQEALQDADPIVRGYAQLALTKIQAQRLAAR
jgi:protein-S-isoprenylcysteine O-methyltransferase Ste14